MNKVSFTDHIDFTNEHKGKFFGAISLFALIYTLDLILNGDFFGFLSIVATFFGFQAFSAIENPLAQIFWIIMFYFLALVLLFLASFVLYNLISYLFMLLKNKD